MMYGFGDDQNPYTESVDLIEDLVIEYLSDMVCFNLSLSHDVYLISEIVITSFTLSYII